MMRFVCSLTALLLLALPHPLAEANGPVTVQARVKSAGALLNGTVDIQATLFDAAVAGQQVAGPQQLSNLIVNEGLLTTQINLGDDFAGTRYLQLSLRTPHDPTDTAPFTPLDQRIEITSAPRAIRAQLAETLLVPATLTANDPNQATLTVINSAPDGVGLQVNGDVIVGPNGQVLLESQTGAVTANLLDIQVDAAVAGVLDVGSGNILLDGPGSLVDVGAGNVQLDGVNGNIGAAGVATALDGMLLGDQANDVSRAAGVFEVALGQAGLPNIILEGDGDVHVSGAYFDSADNSGAANEVLHSSTTGTFWAPLFFQATNANGFAITNIGTGGTAFTPTGGLNLKGDLDLGGFAISNIGAGGSAFTGNGDLSLVGQLIVSDDAEFDAAILDRLNSPGNDRQFLMSTGTQIEWRSPFDQDIDMNANAITNLGSGGSSFGSDGSLIVNADLFVNTGGGSNVLQVDTGSSQLLIGTDRFIVDAASGDTLVEGDLDLSKALIDSVGSPGTPGQLLSSTGTATLWVDCDCSGGGGSETDCNCGDGFSVGDPNTPTFLIGSNGATSMSVDPGTASQAGLELFMGGTGFFNDGIRVLSTSPGRAGSFQASGGGVAVEAFTVSGTQAAVLANNPIGPAGCFGGDVKVTGTVTVTGDLDVTGTVSKGGGSFKIDHPLYPEEMFLYHSFVESPDMLNIYNGNVQTNAEGYAVVELPDWFEALNTDFRYQLTVIDEYDSDAFVQAKVVRGVQGNQFTLRTSEPQALVSWQVTGVRHDPWAEANRIPVEQLKTEEQRGRYLYPELVGAAPELGLGSAGRRELRAAEQRAEQAEAREVGR